MPLDVQEWTDDLEAKAADHAANYPSVTAIIEEVLRLRAELERLELEAGVLSIWLANAYIDIDLLPNIESGAMNPPLPEDVREAAREAARKDEIQT